MRIAIRLATISLLGLAPSIALVAEPISDPRFFGEYCGSASVECCTKVKVKVLGVTVDERIECQMTELQDIRVRLKRLETPKGDLITGSGTADLDDDSIGYVVSGVVHRRGRMLGSGTVQGLKPRRGVLTLSDDGLALTVPVTCRGRNNSGARTITVRKDACGNQPPVATIIHPADGASIAFGSSELFSGNVADAEDDDFRALPQQFVSNRDGPLGGSAIASAGGITLFTNQLSPGDHVISYAATDSGGLTSSASIDVSVTNDPPDEPIIVQPEPGATIVAAPGSVILEGKAYDREDQMLDDGALSWSATPSGETIAIPLGTGRETTAQFAEAGDYDLRLTATDDVGAQSFAELTITVQPFTDNTPPRVTIEIPNLQEVLGMALLHGDIEFVGTVADDEDLVSDLTFGWRVRSISPTGVDIGFGAGSTAPTQTLDAVDNQNTLYEISFSATDSGGLTATTSIELTILASPVL